MGQSERIIKKKFERYAKEFEEEVERTEEALGKPHIMVNVEMPEGCEDMEKEFRDLAQDAGFLKDVKDLVKRHLDKKKEERMREGFNGSDTY